MNVRKAQMKDLPVLLDLYEGARQFMHTHGNPNQWNDGHPNACDLIPDIEQGILYVLEEDGEIEASFVYYEGLDPTYAVIDGEWLNAEPYGVGHKVASRGRVRGMGTEMLRYLKAQHKNIRMDTHADNLPMQKLLHREGFVPCGTIYLKNGDPRMAFMHTAGENLKEDRMPEQKTESRNRNQGSGSAE